MIEATVISGSNNIFEARADDGTVLSECRIKGKVLKSDGDTYNALAPGDRVLVVPDESGASKGSILERLPRRNAFTRWNQKGRSSQVLAANLDLVLCVTTPVSPPFRPRFLDRALLQADAADIPAVILMNKADLDDGDPDVQERIEDFVRIGYRVLRVCSLSGEGLDGLRSLLRGRTAALVGQSGVGKSSVVNALAPEATQKIGAVSEKWDRGAHTTVMARLVAVSGNWDEGRVVDTPGVRRLVPDGVDPASVALYMREFAPLVGTCSFGASCSHVTEPGCHILEGVYAGYIHEDRYESFLRIREELEGAMKSWERYR